MVLGTYKRGTERGRDKLELQCYVGVVHESREKSGSVGLGMFEILVSSAACMLRSRCTPRMAFLANLPARMVAPRLCLSFGIAPLCMAS